MGHFAAALRNLYGQPAESIDASAADQWRTKHERERERLEEKNQSVKERREKRETKSNKSDPSRVGTRKLGQMDGSNRIE